MEKLPAAKPGGNEFCPQITQNDAEMGEEKSGCQGNDERQSTMDGKRTGTELQKYFFQCDEKYAFLEISERRMDIGQNGDFGDFYWKNKKRVKRSVGYNFAEALWFNGGSSLIV